MVTILIVQNQIFYNKIQLQVLLFTPNSYKSEQPQNS